MCDLFIISFQLSNNLIAMAIGLSWTLGYSTFRDGFSLQTLYRKLQEFEECPCILVLKDQLDYVSGTSYYIWHTP